MGHSNDAPPPYTPVDPLANPFTSSTQRPAAPPPPSQYTQPQWQPPPPRPQPTPPIAPTPNPVPHIPWAYPAGFRCDKCNNTGYKLRNGKSCKRCWKQFGPRNRVQYQYLPQNNSGGFRIPFTNMTIHDDLTFSDGHAATQSYVIPGNYNLQPGVHMNVQAPRQVSPGDPSLGGVLCGRCRGSGRVTVMFLDEELCPTCHGVGRVLYG